MVVGRGHHIPVSQKMSVLTFVLSCYHHLHSFNTPPPAAVRHANLSHLGLPSPIGVGQDTPGLLQAPKILAVCPLLARALGHLSFRMALSPGPPLSANLYPGWQGPSTQMALGRTLSLTRSPATPPCSHLHTPSLGLTRPPPINLLPPPWPPVSRLEKETIRAQSWEEGRFVPAGHPAPHTPHR